jgi:hypothetical protein
LSVQPMGAWPYLYSRKAFLPALSAIGVQHV